MFEKIPEFFYHFFKSHTLFREKNVFKDCPPYFNKTETLILFIVALGIILEGLFIIFAAKKARKLILKVSKDLTEFRLLGLMEIIIGIILLVIAL